MAKFVSNHHDVPSKCIKKKMFYRLNLLKSCNNNVNNDFVQRLMHVINLWGTGITLPRNSTGFTDIETFCRRNQNCTHRKFLALEKMKRTVRNDRMNKLCDTESSPTENLENSAGSNRESPQKKQFSTEKNVNYFSEINNNIFTKKPCYVESNSYDKEPINPEIPSDFKGSITDYLNFGKPKPLYKSREETFRLITSKHPPKRGVPVRVCQVVYFVIKEKNIETRDILLIEYMLKSPKFKSEDFDNYNPLKYFTDRIFALIPKNQFISELKKLAPHSPLHEIFHEQQDLPGSLKLAQQEIEKSKSLFYIPSIKRYHDSSRYLNKILTKTANENNLTRLSFSKFMTSSVTISHESSWSLCSKIVLSKDTLRHNEERDNFFQNCLSRVFFKYNFDNGIINSHIMNCSRKG